MELGAEISQKVKKTIKKQLQTLGSYVDDELPEYIMVMIANKRTKAQMIEDLNLFLNDEADKFVAWLFVVLEHIQKAMQLPDIDALVQGSQEVNDKKKKKPKKEQMGSDEEEEDQKQKRNKDSKRHFRESKHCSDDDEKGKGKDQEQREKEREERKREREEKEQEVREKERQKREEERKKREEERKRKEEERRSEIEKRQKQREQRNKERKFKEKGEQPQKHKKEEDANSLENKDESSDQVKVENPTDSDVRKKAEQEAKRIEHRSDKNHNPMDFVKQIANDINQKLIGNQIDKPVEEEVTIEVRSNTDEETAAKDEGNVVFEKVESSGNISLQAVSQYDDGDVESEKGQMNKAKATLTSTEKAKPNELTNRKLSRSKSRSRSRSRTRQDWKRNQRASLTSPDRRRRRSRTNSKDRGYPRAKHRSISRDRRRTSSAGRRHSSDNRRRSRERHRSRSKGRRTRSKDRRSRSKDRRSRSKDKKSPLKDKRSRSKDRRSRSKDRRSRSKDRRSRSKDRRSRERCQDRRKARKHSRSRSNEKQERKAKGIEDNDIGTGDLRKFIDSGSDEEKKKQAVPSQVQVFTDFKRKPSLSKRHQASSALLKRAVTEAVGDQIDVATSQNKEEKEEIELDYTEIDDVLHRPASPEVVAKNQQSADRKVVLDDVGHNLATITVNIKGGKDARDTHVKDERSERRSSSRRGEKKKEEKRRHREPATAKVNSKTADKSNVSSNDDEDINLRRGLLDDMSKVDARYAIYKSRLDTETTRKRNEKRDKYMGSMIADLEESSHKRKHDEEKSIRFKRTREMAQQQRRMDLRKSRLRRRAESSDDELNNMQRNNELQKETERITHRESNRNRSSSDGGDLRNLLRNRKGLRAKDSEEENEDEIARKLREKIKEEKHKKLFGILKSEDKMRLREERDELRQKLEEMRSRRSRSDDRQQENTVSRTSEKYDASEDFDEEEETKTKKRRDDSRLDESKPDKDYDVDDVDKNSSEDEDEWVENEISTSESFNRITEVSQVEETNADDQHGQVEHYVAKPDYDVEEKNDAALESDHSNEELDGGEQPVDQEEECQENCNTQRADSPKATPVSMETLMNSMHQEENSSSENTEKEDENEEREELVDEKKSRKRIHKGEKKSKHKSKKRRHEFVVTLDGFDGSKRLSIKAAAPSRCTRSYSTDKRITKEKTRNHRRSVNNIAHKDGELEDNLKDREKLDEHTRRKKTTREHRHRRHRERKHSTEDMEELSAIDKEIILAEKKLEAQKLLKKSLDQVQSLNTASFCNLKMEPVKPKTAFINPHFLTKTALNSLDTSQSQTIGIASIPAAIAEGNVIQTSFPDTVSTVSNSSHLSSTATVTTAASMTSPTTVTSSNKLVSPTASDKMTNKVQTTAPIAHAIIQERCIYWPDCKNKSCHYIHPTTPCNMFPKCAFGERCLYIHPICKFGDRCTNNECVYSHTGTAPSYQSQPCKFGSKCTKMDCIFQHPVLKPCRFGSSCVKPGCLFLHDKPVAVVNPSQLKWVADKPHVSERKFAVDESVVSNTPVVLETAKNNASVSIETSKTQ